MVVFFFFSSRRRHTRLQGDWSSDVCSSDLHRIHMLEHHGIYSGDALVADTYSDEEKSATAYDAAPAVALGGAAYATLPLDIFVVLVAALSASYAAHVYVPTQYQLNHSWLRRFGWFHRKRELHFVHHRDASKNFGVIEFVWDRVFGTYTPDPRRTRSHRSSWTRHD